MRIEDAGTFAGDSCNCFSAKGLSSFIGGAGFGLMIDY
jgi:hypothetical protein